MYVMFLSMLTWEFDQHSLQPWSLSRRKFCEGEEIRAPHVAHWRRGCQILYSQSNCSAFW